MEEAREQIGKKKTVDMTDGSISSHLIKFAIPLFLGNLFQLMYNMVDTWVVGNYASTAAYSAVGTLGSVMNIMIGLFMGFSSGAGVVISQHFGAGNIEKVKKAVHTSAALTVFFAVIFTIVGLLMVPLMLLILKMPAAVEAEARTYLTVWFSGISGLLIYNMGAGILRAVGDSRRPFMFLVISAVVNTVFDLLFVAVFGMGVAGAALATVIAQGVSAVLVVLLLLRYNGCVKIEPRAIRVDKEASASIFRIGLPTSLQMAVTAFSNVFLQSYVNYFGKEVMGGWTSYSKIDQIIVLPMQSLSIASSTFVGQNLGKGDVRRAKKGANISLLLAFVSTVTLMIPVLIFADRIVWIFNKDTQVIKYGASLIRMLTPFFLFWCVNQIYSGALRGAGRSFTTMVIILSSFVAFRQVYLFIVTKYVANTLTNVAMSYPLGWILACLLTVICYKAMGLSPKRSVVKEIKG